MAKQVPQKPQAETKPETPSGLNMATDEAMLGAEKTVTAVVDTETNEVVQEEVSEVAKPPVRFSAEETARAYVKDTVTSIGLNLQNMQEAKAKLHAWFNAVPEGDDKKELAIKLREIANRYCVLTEALYQEIQFVTSSQM